MTVDAGLRPLFRKHLPQFDWQSIETGGTGRGIPDSNYCVMGTHGIGHEGWIEYKSTDGYVVDLRPEQVGWIMRRVRRGGRVWIAVRRSHDGGPRRGPPVDELWIFGGGLAVEARTGGLLAIENRARRWHHGPTAGWDWGAVAGVLKTRP